MLSRVVCIVALSASLVIDLQGKHTERLLRIHVPYSSAQTDNLVAVWCKSFSFLRDGDFWS